MWVPAVLIVIGLVGIVVPVLPGLLLVLTAVLVWALDTGSAPGWWVFALCAVLYLAGMALQYALPGRRMRAAGVRRTTLLLAVVLAIVGFFVIPVLGAALGFVGGIYLVELGHSRDRYAAWASTRAALGAVFLSIGIELLAGLAIATTWVVAVLVAA
ncbi:MAG: DUF456 domain-containing protein [Pedococcus sp.]